VKTNSLWSDSCKLNVMDYFHDHIININKDRFNITSSEDFISFYKKKNHFDYKLIGIEKDKDEFIDFMFSKAEKDIFTFKNPEIPFMFVFSSHLPSMGKFDIQNGGVVRKVTFPGDGTIDTFPQIYPGLRWLIENKDKENTKPVHFVEYCAVSEKHDALDLSANQHLKIGCDCLNHDKIDIYDNCHHSAMINDNKFINFISEVILKTESKTMQIEGYEHLYDHKTTRSDYCSNLF